MPFYDWICEKGHKEETWCDVTKLPASRACKVCGAESVQLFSGRRNFIHLTHSSQYGKYDPMLGAVVESYGHKQQLMREQNVQESSDPVGGSRSHVPAEYTGNKEKDNAPRKRKEAAWVDRKDLQ